MSSTHKKKIILRNITVKLGCSSSCARPKDSTVFQPKPLHRRRHSKSSAGKFRRGDTDPNHCSSSSLDTSTTTFSSNIRALKAVQGFGRIDGEGVAVEKDSSDPYLDFRQSMLQMILERNIYSKDDLKVLLNCFLQLNSPYYHGIIVRAFTEIWYGIFSARQPPAAAAVEGGGKECASRDF
ncbi:PREDICTED: transcription repressor OFP6-like [Ipomoea nil]|uniref:transcription repressor OFP6-like n=1 Tax=Ipomoea nil TaxID=35883 RepID=UPI000901760C|nr:PREDICTED: transcription repressor OFP6-like [Ipomoea nil]